MQCNCVQLFKVGSHLRWCVTCTLYVCTETGLTRKCWWVWVWISRALSTDTWNWSCGGREGGREGKEKICSEHTYMYMEIHVHSTLAWQK